ncbi:actin cytoskeleton protein-like protein [Sporormia fimetaria CBS 119925]|uniref:Actin cytoskeleton protein-like protein n=1 Tax=Sporormia fimetaria CBS 119925 TaxID=1340428 RepID=A0A6A6VBK0_9PLEO|nr:actin cytoskeleton protein-like protein [Sporormia fimetaria CBS 119925]
MASTVHVQGISKKTSEDEIKSFFSFCGKIQSISVTPTDDETQSASVTFEKAAAAKTALLLDNTQLGPNSVHVTSAKSIDELADEGGPAEGAKAGEGDHNIDQEHKPRSRIIAEYLAQGYAISDNVIEKALALDQQHGVRQKFMSTLENLNSRFHATEKAQALDTKLGVTNKLTAGWGGLMSYFDQAAGTPTGQKIRNFYEAGNKTVMDVHNEALHLKELKKKEAEQKTSSGEAGVSEKAAAPGTAV